MRTGSEFIVASSAARCEIDLSGGGVISPAQPAGRGEEDPLRRDRWRVAHGRATGKPSFETSAWAPSAASSPAIHSAIEPSLMSGAG